MNVTDVSRALGHLDVSAGSMGVKLTREDWIARFGNDDGFNQLDVDKVTTQMNLSMSKNDSLILLMTLMWCTMVLYILLDSPEHASLAPLAFGGIITQTDSVSLQDGTVDVDEISAAARYAAALTAFKHNRGVSLFHPTTNDAKEDLCHGAVSGDL